MAIAHRVIFKLKDVLGDVRSWKGRIASKFYDAIMEGIAIAMDHPDIPEPEPKKEKHIQQYLTWYHSRKNKNLNDREFV